MFAFSDIEMFGGTMPNSFKERIGVGGGEINKRENHTVAYVNPSKPKKCFCTSI